MSWDDKLLKQAKKIIKLYPQKRSALGPLSVSYTHLRAHETR